MEVSQDELSGKFSDPTSSSHQVGSHRLCSQALFPQDKCVNEMGMRTVRPEESGASGGISLHIAKTSRGISDRVGEA